MTTRTLWKITIVVAIIGIISGYIIYKVLSIPTLPAIEVNHTKEQLKDVSDSLENIKTRLESEDRAVKREVQTIYVETKRKVNAMHPDDICNDLNRELSIYRRLATSASRVDN